MLIKPIIKYEQLFLYHKIKSMSQHTHYEDIVTQVRRDILFAWYKVKTWSPGWISGLCRILFASYNEIMELKEGFDMTALTKMYSSYLNGHISPVFYSVLARRGYFPVKELNTFRLIDSHKDILLLMKVYLVFALPLGSLGQGLSGDFEGTSEKLNNDTIPFTP